MMKREGDILVDVHMFTTENGGRNGPTPTKFFGCPAEIQGGAFRLPSYSRRIRAPCAGRHGSSADHVFVTGHRSPDVKGWGRVPTLGIALHRNGEGISFIGRFRHEGSLNPW